MNEDLTGHAPHRPDDQPDPDGQGKAPRGFRRLRGLWNFVRPDWRGIVRDSLAPGRGSLDRISDHFGAIRALLAARERPSEDERIIRGMETDFNVLLMIWGVRPHEIERVKTGLTVEVFIGLVLIAMALWGFVTLLTQGGYIYLVSSSLIMVTGVTMVITRYWRWWCLEHRRFVSFKQWFL